MRPTILGNDSSSTIPDLTPVADLHRSLRWSIIGRFGQHAVLALGLLAPTHLLHPEDFGLFEMILPVLAAATLFRDLGTSSAIVQHSALSTALLSSIFCLNMGVGLLGAVILAGASPLTVALFRERRLGPLMLGIAVAFFAASVGLVPQAVLERRMRFVRLVTIETVATLAGVATAPLMALRGLGVWSLLGQLLIRTMIASSAMAATVDWRPQRVFAWSEIRGVAGYSLNLTAYGILNYLTRNLGNVIIGRYLGSVSLGYYGLAHRVVVYPVQTVGGALSRVLFPALVRVRDNHASVRRLYLGASVAVALLTFPALTVLWAIARPATYLLLGESWTPIVPLLIILAPVATSQCLPTMTGTLYGAKGCMGLVLRVAAVTCSCFVASFLVGIRWGIVGVAWAYTVAMGLVLYPTLAIPRSSRSRELWGDTPRD
jgi:PST family polysaccharide transporter